MTSLELNAAPRGRDVYVCNVTLLSLRTNLDSWRTLPVAPESNLSVSKAN